MGETKFFSHPREWPLWKDMTAIGWRTALYASLGAMIFGYDTAWWSGVLGMPAFTSRYGVYNPTTKAYAISPVHQSSGKCCPSICRNSSNDQTGSGIPTAGRILGSILTPFIADRFGRRGCMLIMSAMFIIAVIVEVTSNSFWQIVVGRFLNYIPMVSSHVIDLFAMSMKC
jgi:SP family sugar:H+ symporter-like MFS transporter